MNPASWLSALALLFFLWLSSSAIAQVVFQTPTPISVPSTPEELAKGDFNNDGLTDFVSVHFNGFSNQQVTVFLNTGTGTFTGTNKRNFSSRRNTLDVEVGDFNEDGNLDVVTISQENTDALSLLLGDGAGNLAAPVFFNAGSTPQGIATGDMNKDNHLDVVVTNRGTPSDVYIFLGNGAGGFSAPTIIAITNVWDVAVADFNNDTNPDFAVVINGPGPSFIASVQVYSGNGSGTAYTAGSAISGFQNSEDVLAANIDDDTDIDILAGGGYSLNDGSGNFGPRVPLSQTNHEFTVVDVNGDTHPDIVANDNNQNTTNVRVFLGDGTGVFTLLAKFETNELSAGLESGDINNDGFIDIIGVGSWGGVPVADVLLGDGTGYFSNTIIKYPVPNDPRDLVKGDFNEDGEVDIALCHSIGNIITIYLGEGGGKFAKTATNYSTESFPSQIISLDYNNDDHLDLVTLNLTAGSITIYTGQGNGNFTLLTSMSAGALAGSRIAAADFNVDGNIDIAVSGYTSNAINILTGTGSGFNTPATVAVSNNAGEIVAGNFTSDSNPDLVLNLSNIDRMVLLTGDGSGGFTEGATQYQHGASFFLAEDINNDTHPDVIAFSNSSSGSDYFINDGAGNFAGSTISSSLGGGPWGYADMDGDGFKDLIAGAQASNSSSPGQIIIIKGTNGGFSNTLLIDKDYSGGNRLVIHELNGDGKPDIIATSFNIYEDYLGSIMNASGAAGCTAPSIGSLSNSIVTCTSSPATFSATASGTAPLTYQWRRGGINISGADSPTYSIPSVSGLDAGMYTVVVTNSCGSVTSNAISLTVNTVPTPSVIHAASCNPASVTLTASGGSPGNYRWYPTSSGGAAIAGEVDNTFTTPLLSATATYYVTIVNGSCESNRIPVTATIGGIACTNQPPAINIATANTQIAGTATIDLTTQVSDADDNLDINSFQILIQPESGAQAEITNGILTVDYTGLTFSGNDRLTIQVCDLLGSCAQQEITIVVGGDLVVYNGISPNGDPYNEKWIIENIQNLNDTRDNKVTIFNRWGDVIIEIENYDNEENVFTGRNKNGNEIPAGVYFYKIEFKSGRGVQAGYLNIKK